MNAAVHAYDSGSTENMSLSEKLNGPWHEKALWVYTAIVLAHWSEHFVQCYQIYVLGWPIKKSLGLLGLFFPSLISSEGLHYGYALVMLVCFWVLRKGFVGRSHTWWMAAFWIQFWHHIEHALLIGQATFHHNFFGSPVPMSIAQLVIPRVELHLFYNSIVTIPMAVAMFYHMFPSSSEEAHMQCTCSRNYQAEPNAEPALP
ncbi:MAG TPA: hypothetical protein VG710_14545 [Opitutus sp.]|nr:hypothetical protein [Opitutus sp.]